MNSKVVAVFTTIFPNDAFFERVFNLKSIFSHVVIVDDTGDLKIEDYATYCYPISSNVSLIKNDINSGIAYSLNKGIEEALRFEADFIVTFDDDTIFCTNYVERCLSFFNNNAHLNIGALAMARGTHFTSCRQGFKKKRALITSGLFCKASIYKDVGSLPTDYFIDLVDFYFSLEARKHGYALIELEDVGMIHKVGNMKTLDYLIKIDVFNHSPFRLYYQVRNSIPFFIKFWRVDLIFCLFILADICKVPIKALLFENQKYERLRYCFKGLLHGLLSRMGRLNE